MVKKNVVYIMLMLLLSFLFNIKADAKSVSDDNIEINIEKVYVQLYKDIYDEGTIFGGAKSKELFFESEIHDYEIFFEEKVSNNQMFYDDIVPIKLAINTNVEDFLKSQLPESLMVSYLDIYTGYLKIQYNIKNKDKGFNNLYYVDFDEIKFGGFSNRVNKIKENKIIEKSSFGEIKDEIVFSTTFWKNNITEYNTDNVIGTEILSGNISWNVKHFLISSQTEDDYKIKLGDKQYYFYTFFGDDYSILNYKSMIDIDVRDYEGKAIIKGISIFSNSICEIYRRDSIDDNYEYVSDIICDGETEYNDYVELESYYYKLKLKDFEIYSKEHYANLSERFYYDEDDCNALFCEPKFTFWEEFLLLSFLILPLLFVTLLICYIIIKNKNKKKGINT